MKFTLPPKEEKEKGDALPAGSCCDDSYERDPYHYIRRVTIPVNDEILKSSPVGVEVSVTLKGKICAAEDDTHYEGEQIRVSVTEIEVLPQNEFSKLAEDD